MFASIYTSLSGGLMQERRLEVISNNLANANTNGFKRDLPVFQSFLTAEGRSDNVRVGAPSVTENAVNTPNLQEYINKGTMNVTAGVMKERIANENVFVKTSEIRTDFEQGPLKPTGNELDIAIEGKGLFAFQTNNGVMYGRNGTFHLNSNGEVVTTEGHRLLDRNNNPIVLNEQLYDSFTFDKNGEVIASKDGRNLTLAIVNVAEFENPAKLEKVGSSLYRNINNAAGEKTQQESKLVQGFVELSNVNVVREMTEMIQASRGYQTMQKVIQSIDGINDKLIQNVGRPI